MGMGRLLPVGIVLMVVGASFALQTCYLLLRRTELHYTDKVYFPDGRHTRPLVVSTWEAWQRYRSYYHVYERPEAKLPREGPWFAAFFWITGSGFVVLHFALRWWKMRSGSGESSDYAKNVSRTSKAMWGVALCFFLVSAFLAGLAFHPIQEFLEFERVMSRHGGSIPLWQWFRVHQIWVPVVFALSGLSLALLSRQKALLERFVRVSRPIKLGVVGVSVLVLGTILLGVWHWLYPWYVNPDGQSLVYLVWLVGGILVAIATLFELKGNTIVGWMASQV